MFLKRLKLGWLVPVLFMLGGCAEVAVSPVEQVQQVQQTNPVVQPKTTSKRSVVSNQAVSLYHCKDDIEVRVLKSKNKKNSKHNNISVTFMGTTHTLSPAVTKNGKKYSNIRWIWWEPRTGGCELLDNNKNVLAEKCIKQR